MPALVCYILQKLGAYVLLVLLGSHEGILGRRLGFWVCCAKGALFLARRKHVLLEGNLNTRL